MAVWRFIVHPPTASGGDADRKRLVALDEARIHPLWLVHHLNLVKSLEDLLPDDLQLQLRQPHANAAVDAETERQMDARARAIDQELVGPLDCGLVAVARDVPHHDLVALLDLFAAKLEVIKRGAAHMRKGRLPADHFRYETVEQRRVFPQLPVLIGK